MRLYARFACLLGFAFSLNPAQAQDGCTLIYRGNFEIMGNNALARDDQGQTFEGKAVFIDVLENDEIPQGATCAAPGDAEPMLVRQPPSSEGAVQLQVLLGRFVVRFVPAPGFVGTTSFDYELVIVSESLRSNRATVTVQVHSAAPVAVDDRVLSCLPVLDIDVLGNDRFPMFGPFLDESSLVVQGVDSPTDAADVLDEGRVRFSTSRTPPYTTAFSYRVSNDAGQASEPATVRVDCLQDFAGEAGSPPVDGLDAQQLEFVTEWRGTTVWGGTGSLAGLMHANQGSLAGCFFVADYTQTCVADLRSEPGGASSYQVSTGQQVFTMAVQPDGQVEVEGLEPGPVFPPDPGNTVIVPEGGPPVEFAASSSKPNVDLQSLTPADFDAFGIGELLALFEFLIDDVFDLHVMRTTESGRSRRNSRIQEVTIPPLTEDPQDQSVEFDTDPIELGDGEEILALPSATKQLAGGEPARRARLHLLPEATRHAITSRGRTVTGLATAALVGRQETQNLFTAPGQRPVPIRLGFGVAVPGSTLTPPRFDACLQPPQAPLCNYGPHPRLLAVNQNGDVSVHDPDDGRLLYHLLGGSAPNFTVDNGWHLIQDPNTGCLLFSDSGNQAIHRYDTNGQLLNAAFINLGAGSGPRGMDFLEGDLLVATHTDGRIRRYRSDGSFVADQLTGTGNPNAVFTLPGGDLLVVDESGSAGTRTVRRYPIDGGTPETMVSGLGLAYQIAQDFDGHYLLAHFGLGRIEVFNFGFPSIAAASLGSDGTGSRSPRGIAPLRNGKWLVSGNNGTGVAVLDPQTPESVETLVAGNTFRFIEPACLPQ